MRYEKAIRHITNNPVSFILYERMRIVRKVQVICFFLDKATKAVLK